MLVMNCKLPLSSIQSDIFSLSRHLDLDGLLEEFPLFDKQRLQFRDCEDVLQYLHHSAKAYDDKQEKKSPRRPLLKKTMQEKRDEINTRERNRRRAIIRLGQTITISFQACTSHSYYLWSNILLGCHVQSRNL